MAGMRHRLPAMYERRQRLLNRLSRPEAIATCPGYLATRDQLEDVEQSICAHRNERGYFVRFLGGTSNFWTAVKAVVEY